MFKLLVKLLLFNLPFFLIGGILIYLGFTTSPTALTGDGYNRKTFFFMMGAGFGLLPFILIFGVLVFAFFKRKRIQEIVTHGQQGTAKILSLNDTGTRINDDPRVKLRLEISIPNYPVYEAQKTVTIPLIYLPQVQTGSIIQIMADPSQPGNEKRIGLVLK